MEPLNFPFTATRTAPIPRRLFIEQAGRRPKWDPATFGRIEISPDIRGHSMIQASCYCRGSKAAAKYQLPLAQIVLFRHVVTIEGWLALDYYLGSCSFCSRTFWG